MWQKITNQEESPKNQAKGTQKSEKGNPPPRANSEFNQGIYTVARAKYSAQKDFIINMDQ